MADAADRSAGSAEPAAGDSEPARPDDGAETAGGAEETSGGGDIPSRLRELGSYIRSQRTSAELSLRKLARLAGVSNPYLSQIERGLRKPSAEILQAIAKGLSISAETLYVKAGILDERDGDHDLEVAIARDPHLTEAQREALIEMYRSFRRLAKFQDREESAG